MFSFKNKPTLIIIFLGIISLNFAPIVADDHAKVDKDKLLELIKGANPLIWVFTGNSITQGAKHTHGLRSYPEICSERIRYELGRSRDFIINTAISGNTSKDILADFDRRIGILHPKVVSLMIGTNDAAISNNISISQFEQNLTQLLTKIRGIGAIPILLTPPRIIEAKAPERNRLGEYVLSIQAVAKRDKVILVDNWLIWDTEMKSKYQNEVNKYLLNDPLHPNGLGHKEIAISIFKELSIFNEKDPTCGGSYYEGDH